MQSHSVGPLQGNRLGSDIVKQSWTFLSSVVGSSYGPVTLAILPATSARPIAYGLKALLRTGFNSSVTPATLTVTSSDGTTLFNGVTIGQSAGTAGLVFTSTPEYRYIYSTETLTLSISDTFTTGNGEVSIVLDAYEINTSALTTLGS